MPPWHADPDYGKFIGSREMGEADRQVLVDWVAQGMPEGDAADLPVLPNRVAGWQLPSPPDAQFTMRDRPFVVPADGVVEYQYFVVDPGWKEDRWVRAVQVVPGDSSVVHHSIVFVRSPDGSESRGIGWLGGYVPGQRVIPLPDGYARRVPAGSKFVFQMHYTPNGRVTNDLTKVAVWFADAGDVTHEVTTRVALNHDFEIPPGVKDHTVRVSMDRFARDSQLLSVTPHMHLRGKSFHLSARGRTKNETQLNVPNYDFNWQHWYHFVTPLSLDDVASLEMEVHFDNSQDNPTNPDPRAYVTWGDQTFEEMAVAFFEIAHPRDQPHRWNDESLAESAERRRARLASVAGEVDRFMRELDADGDGVVLREEVPDSFRIFGFRDVDSNNDGRIDRDEAEGAAAARHEHAGALDLTMNHLEESNETERSAPRPPLFLLVGGQLRSAGGRSADVFQSVLIGYWQPSLILDLFRAPPRKRWMRMKARDRGRCGYRSAAPEVDPFSVGGGACVVVATSSDFFTTENLTAIRAAVAELERLPQVRRVQWIDSIPGLNLFGLPESPLPRSDASDRQMEDARDARWIIRWRWVSLFQRTAKQYC